MEKIIINSREEVEAAMQVLQSNNYIQEAQQLFDWWQNGHTNGQDWRTFDGLDALVDGIKQQQVKKAERKAKKAESTTGKRGRKKQQEKPLSADDALTLLQTLADIQGLTVADLTKQLDSQKKEMAKKHHGELLQKYYEANEALQKYKDEWAEVINEYDRLNNESLKAGREAQQFADTYKIK